MIEKEPFLHKDGKLKYDYSNTLNLDVRMTDAKTYFDLRGLDFSKLNVLGSDRKHHGDNPLYNFNGSATEFSVFVYDRKRNNRLGNVTLNPTTKKGVTKKGVLVPFGYCTRKGRVQIQMNRDLFNGEIVTELPKGYIT
jgi:hypothetical protein